MAKYDVNINVHKQNKTIIFTKNFFLFNSSDLGHAWGQVVALVESLQAAFRGCFVLVYSCWLLLRVQVTVWR